MKQIDINIPLISAKYRELDATQRDLVDKARAMTRHSYAPYSKFHVGAAILLDNGEIITGSNQENVAYPSGISSHPHITLRSMPSGAARVRTARRDRCSSTACRSRRYIHHTLHTFAHAACLR